MLPRERDRRQKTERPEPRIREVPVVFFPSNSPEIKILVLFDFLIKQRNCHSIKLLRGGNISGLVTFRVYKLTNNSAYLKQNGLISSFHFFSS